MICIDGCDRVIKNKFIGAGLNEFEVARREIVAEAIATNAAGVILAHNHPNGILKPSQEDYIATKTVNELLNSISVRLIDHFIFCDRDYISIMNDHSFSFLK